MFFGLEVNQFLPTDNRGVVTRENISTLYTLLWDVQLSHQFGNFLSKDLNQIVKDYLEL